MNEMYSKDSENFSKLLQAIDTATNVSIANNTMKVHGEVRELSVNVSSGFRNVQSIFA